MIEVGIRRKLGDFALDADFTAPGEGVTALFGPSGAGKSSIVNAIAGLMRGGGRIAVNGDVFEDAAAGVFLPARRRRIGYVFQDARLFPHMSVMNNALYGWRRSGRRAEAAEIEKLLALLGVAHLRDRRTASLSGGEKQRVALARALLVSPRALLLDEPLASLDEARKQEIMPYLERLKAEARIPIVLVSHSIDEVTRLADHVVLVRNGRVEGAGGLFAMTQRLNGLGASPGAVLEARVSRRLHAEGLLELDTSAGALLAPLAPHAEGTRLRLRIPAHDVMIALEWPHGLSALNILETAVTAVGVESSGHVDVALLCGEATLIARVTQNSAERLQLRPGLRVFAIVKAVTLLRDMGHGE